MLPGGIGFGEILIILVVAVILFGSRLPEVAKNLGKSYQQFRKGLAELQSSIRLDDDVDYNASSNNYYSKRLAHYKDAADQDRQDDVPRFIVPPTDETVGNSPRHDDSLSPDSTSSPNASD